MLSRLSNASKKLRGVGGRTSISAEFSGLRSFHVTISEVTNRHYERRLAWPAVPERKLSSAKHTSTKYEAVASAAEAHRLYRMTRTAQKFAKSFFAYASDRSAVRATDQQLWSTFISDPDMLASFEMNSLVLTLKSLAFLSEDLSSKNGDNRRLVLTLIHEISLRTSIESSDLLGVLQSLWNLRFNWFDLPVFERTKLFQLYIKAFENSRKTNHIAFVLNTSYKLGLKWDDIPKDTQYSLLNAILANTSQFTLQNGPLLVSSLSRLGYNLRHAPLFFRQALDSILLNVLTYCEELTNPDEISEHYDRILFALPFMNFEYTDQSEGLRRILRHVPEKQMEHMSIKALPYVIFGLGRIHTPWSDFSEASQLMIQAQIGANFESLNEGQKAYVLSGLGGMRIQYSAIHAVIRDIIESDVSKSLGTMSVRNILKTVESLSKLNASWNDLPEQLTLSVEYALIRHLPHMNEKDVFTVLSALSDMQIKFSATLSRKLQRALSQAIAVNLPLRQERNLAAAIETFGRLDMKWSSLPSTVQDCIQSSLLSKLPQMDPKQVGITMSGLEAMEVHFKEHLSEELQSVIVDILAYKMNNIHMWEAAEALQGMSQLQMGSSAPPPATPTAQPVTP